MKRKWITVMLCITLGTFGLSGCGSAETSQAGEAEVEVSSAQAETEETLVEETELEQQAKNPAAGSGAIYGEVSEIGDDTITLATGTLNLAEPSEDADEEDISLIELDGDETVIQLTDSTVYKQQSMGNGAPRDGAPKMEDGEEPPERPDGDEAPADGQEPPQKPDRDGKGGPGDGEEPPERPDGDEAPADGQEPSQKPDRDGKGAPGDGGEAPQMGGNLTEITLEDISEGDILSVTLDEDGNAAEIIVLSAAE